MRRRQGNRRIQPKKDLHKINHNIRCLKVRVVEGLEPDIYDTSYAIKMAEEMELDLIMITENANPPVCRILDYKKFLYQIRKEKRTLKIKLKRL